MIYTAADLIAIANKAEDFARISVLNYQRTNSDDLYTRGVHYGKAEAYSTLALGIRQAVHSDPNSGLDTGDGVE